jgi:hypothetical protein
MNIYGVYGKLLMKIKKIGNSWNLILKHCR